MNKKQMMNSTNSNYERPKEFVDRDLHVQLQFPTISWSSFHAFTEYDKDQWYNQYVLGIRSKPNGAMQAGIEIGERLVADKDFLPEVPRPDIYEHELTGRVGHIKLRGHLDGFSPDKKHLIEYKTAQKDDRWTQTEVDNWGQITMYTFLIWMHYKIKPEDLHIRLVSIPVKEHQDFTVRLDDTRKPKVFTTKRTFADMLNFANEVKKGHAEMVAYVEQRKSVDN